MCNQIRHITINAMKEIEQSAVSASSSVITLFHIFQINTPASHSLVNQLPAPVSFHNIP